MNKEDLRQLLISSKTRVWVLKHNLSKEDCLKMSRLVDQAPGHIVDRSAEAVCRWAYTQSRGAVNG